MTRPTSPTWPWSWRRWWSSRPSCCAGPSNKDGGSGIPAMRQAGRPGGGVRKGFHGCRARSPLGLLSLQPIGVDRGRGIQPWDGGLGLAVAPGRGVGGRRVAWAVRAVAAGGREGSGGSRPRGAGGCPGAGVGRGRPGRRRPAGLLGRPDGAALLVVLLVVLVARRPGGGRGGRHGRLRPARGAAGDAGGPPASTAENPSQILGGPPAAPEVGPTVRRWLGRVRVHAGRRGAAERGRAGHGADQPGRRARRRGHHRPVLPCLPARGAGVRSRAAAGRPAAGDREGGRPDRDVVVPYSGLRMGVLLAATGCLTLPMLGFVVFADAFADDPGASPWPVRLIGAVGVVFSGSGLFIAARRGRGRRWRVLLIPSAVVIVAGGARTVVPWAAIQQVRATEVTTYVRGVRISEPLVGIDVSDPGEVRT